MQARKADVVKKISIEELARLICSLPLRGELVFYATEEGDSYGATRQQFFESEMVILNYFGGGNPYIIDLEWCAEQEKEQDILHGLKAYADHSGIVGFYIED